MKFILISLGFLSFILGVIGAFLPLLPTTPFILLAAFFFSKSSDKFYQWLIDMPAFGGMIKDWNEYGVVSNKGKMASATAITGVIVYIFIFRDYALHWKLAISMIMLSVVVYVVSRPGEKKRQTDKLE